MKNKIDKIIIKAKYNKYGYYDIVVSNNDVNNTLLEGVPEYNVNKAIELATESVVKSIDSKLKTKVKNYKKQSEVIVYE